MAVLAYSPTLHLLESHVAIYKIYTLKNPFNNEIFYVGQTLQELEVRLYAHIKETESNKQKSEYIKNILENCGKPIIESVETIQGTCYIDKMFLNEREKYWIKYFKSLGCTLLNIASMGINDKCNEYHSYLSSLKRGEGQSHFYYCGKTRSGVKVYDEKKMIADGFKLRQEPMPMYERNVMDNEEYNPWDNPRFIKKIGYRQRDSYLSYIPCYNDTNSDFYDKDY